MIGNVWERKLLTSWRLSKKTVGKDWGSSIPCIGMPAMTGLPPTRPHPLRVLPPPNGATSWGPNFKDFGRIIQTIANI
jgi:hypothetical protein